MDLKTLSKMESLPASLQADGPADNETLLLLVKLHEGSEIPSYVTPRMKMGARMFSTAVQPQDLSRLEADPAVESMSLSRSLPVIE